MCQIYKKCINTHCKVYVNGYVHMKYKNKENMDKDIIPEPHLYWKVTT